MSATTTTPIKQHAKVKPFYFNTSANLLRITRYKANTLSEFLQAVRDCPEDSIFQHTFRTLEEHHFIREGFSNDFAHWAFSACNEPGLAEQFAGVDVKRHITQRVKSAKVFADVADFDAHVDSLKKQCWCELLQSQEHLGAGFAGPLVLPLQGGGVAT